ncbi:hypothetical protein [Maribacter hydrothermalis]|uniref:hypothetical protein n=1 Tax=Maribacter hydrothermalis TaxID=1836467 RepID=UPI0009FAB15A|nr:hypothetical protein [Maribacter hydrothermalis]
MRNNSLKLLISIVVIFLNSCNIKKQDLRDSNVLTKDNTYLGQQPPGIEPALFAPEIIKTE